MSLAWALAARKTPSPTDLQANWDAFYKTWVSPTVHFGTPLLVIFAALLVVARPLTRLVVMSDTNGARSSHLPARVALGSAYAVGVLALLGAAAQLAVGYPLLDQRTTADGGSWIGAAAIGVGVAVCATVPLVFLAVGHLSLTTRATHGDNQGRSVAGAIVLVVAVAIGGAVLLLGMYGLWWHYPWLRGPVAALVSAAVLAVAGLLVVARTRGVGIGLQVQGKDKSGADDSALGAAVRARLFDLGTRGPAGLTRVAQTDVSSIPSSALSLLPDGVAAKLAAALIAIFTPATPWLVEVTEQADGTVLVSISRNGRVVEATTLRPAVVGLAQLRPSPGTVPTTDWSRELRTAAASFVLLTLAERYEHIRAGLGGATRWRSVAQQVIASDAATPLNDDQRKDLLAQAIGQDPGNLVAQFEYLRRAHGERTDDTDDYVAHLAAVAHEASSEGTAPLRLRVQYSMVVALLNDVAGRPVAWPRESGPHAVHRGEPVSVALVRAHQLLAEMDAFWAQPGQKQRYAELWHDMGAPIEEAAGVLGAEWRRRFAHELPASADVREVPAVGEPVLTLWALYQRACKRVVDALSVQTAAREPLLRKALDDLTLALAVPSSRVAARTDVSFDALHDPSALDEPSILHDAASVDEAFVRVAKEFKALVGDPVPSSFLGLAPFVGWADKLADRGVHTAEQLWGRNVPWLTAELGITRGVAERWRSLAWLCQQLGEDSTPVVFLLLRQDIGSIDELKASDVKALHKKLLDGARPWAVVAPTARQVEAWQVLATEPPPAAAPKPRRTPPPPPVQPRTSRLEQLLRGLQDG